MKRIAVLASGRGSNFEALCRADLGSASVVLLLSDREDAPVLRRAEELGVERAFLDPGAGRSTLTRERESAWADLLEAGRIDLVCLAGFMRILRGPVLERFAGRILNVHPSLLPAFAGLHAQQRAFEYGVRVSGCTVHYVDAGMDTGPIVLQSAVEVLGSDTAETLSGRILEEEHRIYPLAVRMHCEGRLSVSGRVVRISGEGPGPVS